MSCSFLSGTVILREDGWPLCENNSRRGFERSESFWVISSCPVTERLKEWLQNQLSQRRVKRNSSMGKAIAYILNHWGPLTLFIPVPGAPLDNNLCEQILKRAI